MPKKPFSWSPIRRLMKEKGADIASRDAVDALIDHLEKLTKSASESALIFGEYGTKRKKITKEDLDIFFKYL